MKTCKRMNKWINDEIATTIVIIITIHTISQSSSPSSPSQALHRLRRRPHPPVVSLLPLGPRRLRRLRGLRPPRQRPDREAGPDPRLPRRRQTPPPPWDDRGVRGCCGRRRAEVRRPSVRGSEGAWLGLGHLAVLGVTSIR